MKNWYAVLLMFLSLFSANTSFGQKAIQIPTNYAAIDTHALKAPKSATKSIESLSEYLVSNTSNPFLKLRAIYTWTSQNVEYDWYQFIYNEHLTVKSIPKEKRSFYTGLEYWWYAMRLNMGWRKMYKLTSPERVLKTKKAVCHDYAQLVNELCFESGLRSVEVIGYLKDNDFQRGDLLFRSNHAWNAVAIARKWHMIDATNKLWITDKDTMEQYMLPSDPIWQLKEEPISTEEFSKDSIGEYYWDSYDFMDSISEIIVKEPIDMLLQSGMNAKRHNGLNNRDIAYAYFNHANFFLGKAKSTKNDYDTEMKAYLRAKESFDSSKVYLKAIKKVEIKQVNSRNKLAQKESFKKEKYALKLAIKLQQDSTKIFTRGKKDYLKLLKTKYKKLIDSTKAISTEHIASIDPSEKIEIKKTKTRYKKELDTLRLQKESDIAFIERYNEEAIKKYTKVQNKKIKDLEKKLKSSEKSNLKAQKSELRRVLKEKKKNIRDTDFAKKMSKYCKSKYKKMKSAYYTKG